MLVRFVCASYNIQNNVDNLINSVCEQKNDNWTLHIIDDLSNDNTENIVKQKIENSNFKDKIFYVKNTEKKYALRNIIEFARQYQDCENSIIACLDGDDQLCNVNTVDLLLQQYRDGHEVVWTAHRWDINGMNISKPMPPNINPYQWPWSASHLRTFKSNLLKKINDKNFTHPDGHWFQRGYDQALMLPVLYIAKKRKYISDVCYLYNIDSTSIPKDERNWCENKQHATINIVRSRGFVK